LSATKVLLLATGWILSVATLHAQPEDYDVDLPRVTGSSLPPGAEWQLGEMPSSTLSAPNPYEHFLYLRHIPARGTAAADSLVPVRVVGDDFVARAPYETALVSTRRKKMCSLRTRNTFTNSTRQNNSPSNYAIMKTKNIEPNGSRRGLVPMLLTALVIAPTFLPLGVFSAEPPSSPGLAAPSGVRSTPQPSPGLAAPSEVGLAPQPGMMKSTDQPRPRPVLCEAAGAVAPAQVVQVRASIPGQVVRLLVEPGATVKAGDLLAVMDDAKYKLEVERLKAKLDVAMSWYQELKTAQGELGKASAAARLASARDQVRRAETALRQALPVASSIVPGPLSLVGVNDAETNRITPQGNTATAAAQTQMTDRARQSKLKAESLAAELEMAKSEYEKAKTGIEKDRAVELERLKSAQSTVQIAEAELRLAQNDLAGTEIRSSIAGTILRREAKVGLAFNPNLPGEHSAPLFEVANLSDLVVEADVPHHFFSALSIGQPCSVLETKSSPLYAGKIKSIELHPGASTHSLRVRVWD
jgi:multidrug resistance efflux pump